MDVHSVPRAGRHVLSIKTQVCKLAPHRCAVGQDQVIRVMNTQSNVVVNALVVQSGVVSVSRTGAQTSSYN